MMSLKSSSSIGKLIDDVIADVLRKKGVALVKETTLDEDQVMKPDVKKDPATANISGQAKTAADEEEERILRRGEITLDDIKDKLNALRAGRSIKDPNISHELETYFESLTQEEQIALFAYLKGMAEIVSGEHAGENALEPGDNPSSITMLRARWGKKTIDPDVVVKDSGGSKNDEDRAPPSPIKPKTR